MGSSKKYNAMRLTGPDRLVVDIPGMKAPANQKTINVNSKLISTIRYAKLGSNTARVVLDINSQMQYNVLEKNGKLVLEVENPTYRNITYCNNGDRVFFTLKGARLTEGGQDLKTLYTGKYAENGLKYTMTFSGNLADLGSGTIKINDGLVDSADIVKDPNTGLTSITFSSKEKLTYLAITRPEAGDTTITVLKPASAKEKLVVIDAGHGGFEPGAVYGSLKEKDLNLDIAIRLNTLLEKKKIKTYMLRENDSYVGLYERTHIANNLNASLFLSIHNNAIGDPGFGGTMTLYYPQMSNSTAFNGRRFAQIIQTKLLSKLGTTDRRIIERPNLVVLKATTMPAALAEVAFVTNAKDRNALQTAAFKQNAAQALCDGIVQALKEIK
jgi:N-acetylmuramoyl-L-alanine amidase